MAQTVTLPDAVYQTLERLAKAQGQTPEDLIAAWVNEQEQTRERRTFHSDEEFMRALGMDDDDIAWVEAQPIEADPSEYTDADV
ncbi:MAG TPA: hypothetical protein VH599_01320 [Ktedonobacterales bacterium]|jgi:hypothetical protein